MRSAIARLAPAFIVNLRSRDLGVAEQFLHGTDIDAGREQQGRSRCAQRIRRKKTTLRMRTNDKLDLFHRPWHLLQLTE
jgi:hypothetical protein